MTDMETKQTDNITLPDTLTPMQALELLHCLTGCKAIAMDMSGKWFLYQNEPYIHGSSSIYRVAEDDNEDMDAFFPITHPITYSGDWRDSLHVIGKGQVKRGGGAE